MTCRIKIPVQSLWCIVLFSLAPAAAELDFLSNAPFAGLSADYSERRGTYDLGGGGTQDVNLNDCITYGITGGKRFPLTPWLRLQVAGVVQYGSVVDDTLPAGTSVDSAAIVRKMLLQGGIIADLQYPINLSGGKLSRSRFYLHAGGGLHLARIWESEVLLDNQSEAVTGDPALLSPQVMLSPSVHGGIGWEVKLSRTLGLALSYSLNYGDLVHYTSTDFGYFPLGIPYSERFISHQIDVVFLFR